MFLLDLIGNTPLVNLSFLSARPDQVKLFAKAEWLNPGGSLKDRPVKAMLNYAIARGQLKPEQVILDSSSGNAGISYAMIGAALGYQVTIVIPGNASNERKMRMLAHGAQLIETDPLEGYDQALRHARALAIDNPKHYFFCDQYANQQNMLTHYLTTAGELLAQVPNEITHFVAGVGTGGSITGIARRLKEHNPEIKIIGVRPQEWPGIEGLKPLQAKDSIVPDIFDSSLIDQWIDVTSDEAKAMCHTLAKAGYFVGQSSGAYVAASLKLMGSLSMGVITTLLCDAGERYFSTRLWQSSGDNDGD